MKLLESSKMRLSLCIFFIITFIYTVASVNMPCKLPIDYNMSQNIEKFSSKLYKEIPKRPKENLLISPLAIGYLLSLFAINSTNESLDELSTVLDIHRNLIEKHYNCYLEILNKDSTFNLSKGIISNDSTFRAEVTNKIQATSLNIVNLNNYTVSISFNPKWEERYSVISSTKGTFFTSGLMNYYVTMLSLESYFTHGNISGIPASFIELPFKNDFYMLIVLPHEINGIESVEQSLGSLTIEEITRNNEKTHLDVNLPLFEIDVTTDVTQVLKKMGIQNLFNTNSEYLFRDVFKQNSYIRVKDSHGDDDSENGGFSFIPISLDSGKIYNINRPFHYKIIKRYSSEENVVLFVGNVKSF
ncbi:antitrypsin-like [Leptopilina boulardi]|uniref:antitrypsin-like n=1 Tax=Leptopilina boulardi TaxID=63433 RepID=UPI0021F51A85|nr:antitrypsin-like [Leptopilina boulardi]